MGRRAGRARDGSEANPIDERTYLDPGLVIIEGGPELLTSPRQATMGVDPLYRTHPAGAWGFHYGGPTATDGPTYLTGNTTYDVIFTGSANMPAQIFDEVLAMPAELELPGGPPYPAAVLPAGTAQTFTWPVVASMTPAGTQVMSLIAFAGEAGPAVICYEPQDGSITVPAAMIDVVRAAYPDGGTLTRQTLTHVVRELVDRTGPTGKRIDFIAAWGYETSFTVP